MAANEETLGAPPVLTPADRLTLLQVARQSVANYFARVEDPPPDTDSPVLLAHGACFVTLWSRTGGELRGCRGEVTAHQPLIAAVTQIAIAAATDDPRFVPVTPAELLCLRFEISVLSPMQPIRPQDVELGRHGLFVVRGGQRGLLLPQVPVEHGMDRAEFLRAVCWKAGLPADAWQQAGTRLFSFTTDTWDEDNP